MSLINGQSEITDPNQHVRDYLDYFLGLKHAPNYAVLLNGPWGVGKTHFIRSYLSSHFSTDPTKHLYLSLFGLKTRDEITEALFQAAYPLLGWQVTKLGAKVGKSALKTFGIELGPVLN